MASEKEIVVIILDVSKTMCHKSTAPLEGAIQAVNLLVQQKILFKPKDEISLVLVGTQETKNALAEDGYQNIYVEREIDVPDLELVRQIQRIKPGGAEGDVIDALIVGMDMLITKTKTLKKSSCRLFLVTNAASPINVDDLDTVLDQFKKMNAHLNIIGIDFDDFDEDEECTTTEDDENLSIKKKNERLLREITSKVDGVVVPVQRAIEVMSYFRSPPVLQRPVFQGHLEISDAMKIRVKAFLKTKKVNFPTMKKMSLLVDADAEVNEVTRQVSHHSIDDIDTEILASEKLKGYKYGRSIVPFSDVDESVLKYNATTCLKLIGFTKNTNVPPHHYMGQTEVISSDPTDENAAVAISALARAMIETESFAIVRYCKRKDSVLLAVLQPHVTAEQENFYLHKLPFAEDIRYYPFAPLDPDRTRPAYVPSTEQLTAIENLINDLDLSNAAIDEDNENMESLKPKYTYNPVLQRFYQTLQIRSLNPQAPIPKLDPVIEEYVNPDEKLLSKAEKSFEAIETLFPLERVKAEATVVQRRYWANANVDELRLDSYVNDDGSGVSKKNDERGNLDLDEIITGGTSDVSSIHPVKSFQEMLSRRDVDLVDKAIEQMKQRILQLVNDSVRDQLYPKALECLQALREGCIKEEESAAFNTFLRLVRSMYEDKRHAAFWNLVVHSKISLIHDEECEDSDVTKDQSDDFLKVEIATEEAPTTSSDVAEGDEEDLFDLIE